MVYLELYESCRAERDHAPLLLINAHPMTPTSLTPFLSLLLTSRLLYTEASPLLTTLPIIAHWCQRGTPSSPRFSSTFPMYCACSFPARESQGWRIPESRVVPPATRWPQIVALYKWPRQPKMRLETLAKMKHVKVELSWNRNLTAVEGAMGTIREIMESREGQGDAEGGPCKGRKLEVTVHFPLVPSTSREQRDSREFFHGNALHSTTRSLMPLRKLLGELQRRRRLDWGITMGLVFPKRTTTRQMREMGPWPTCKGARGEGKESDGLEVRPRQLSRTRSRCGIGVGVTRGAGERPIICWAIRADGESDEVEESLDEEWK